MAGAGIVARDAAPVLVVPTRVVIIDDSVVARVMLSQAFDAAPEFQIAAAFDRVERALAWLALNPCDLILLDLELPGRSGLAALSDLLIASGNARVVIVSSSAAEGAAATLEALSLGAADAIAKPESGAIGRFFGAALIERLRRIAGPGEMPVNRPPVARMRDVGRAPLHCVAIGASTGGIHAIARLFAALPSSFDAPILVTQHLPPSFMPYFAAQLTHATQRRCVVACDGEVLSGGTIHVAPGTQHLTVRRNGEAVVIALNDAPADTRCMPSVDPMFASVASAFGSGAIGVMLSGMGRDGAEGAAAIVDQGGSIIAQDMESSTIWGMPGTVVRLGLVSLIAPPERLADHLAWRGSAT